MSWRDTTEIAHNIDHKDIEPGLRTLNEVLALDVRVPEESAVDRRRGSSKHAADARTEVLNHSDFAVVASDSEVLVQYSVKPLSSLSADTNTTWE